MMEDIAINWDDPEERARLAERIGLKAYNEALDKHIKQSTVATVGGHAIRPVQSRFGQLWQVGNTGHLFSTRRQAEAYAWTYPAEDYDHNE